jgi:hypothetical protein
LEVALLQNQLRVEREHYVSADENKSNRVACVQELIRQFHSDASLAIYRSVSSAIPDKWTPRKTGSAGGRGVIRFCS